MNLPEGWVEARLDQVAEVTLGQSPPGSSYNSDGLGVPFFQGKAEFGSLSPEIKKWTTDPRKHASAGDVLLSVRAPVGPTNIAPCHCAIGRGLAAIHPRGGVSPRYLLWGLRATAFALRAQATGTTFAAVAGSDVRAHRIPVAPLTEQRRIVEALEEHFSRLEVADEALEAAARRLGVLRLRAVEAAFAAEWPFTTLGEVAEIVGGVTKDAKRQDDPSFVEVPYLRVANVQRGYLDLGEVSTIRVSPEKAKALELKAGDVLFNEGGDRDKLGRGWVWSGEIKRCIHQNHVFRARLRAEFEPKFVSWHGNTFGRRWFEEHGRQTTNLASLNLTTLKSFPVPAPPLEEQRRVVAEIERQLSIADALEVSVKVARRRSIALRSSILAQAFRGELVLQDLSDEPASGFIKRLVTEQDSRRKHPRRRTKTSA